MKLSPAQLKGRIKNLAIINHADPRVLIRIYMMERFLERISVSRFRNQFIIKGGILVTSLIGIALRSTMDIDTSIKNLNLSPEDILTDMKEICSIDLHDGVTFQIKQLSQIMDEMEYPGIRITANAYLGQMPIPLKIDVSTGDIITPKEIRYEYKLLLENRSIQLWSYNLETLLAEKLQTILARGTLNTRMRDYYDLYELNQGYKNKISYSILKNAFQATCIQRKSIFLFEKANKISHALQQDQNLQQLWKSYQRKYFYAASVPYTDIMKVICFLVEKIDQNL